MVSVAAMILQKVRQIKKACDEAKKREFVALFG